MGVSVMGIMMCIQMIHIKRVYPKVPSQNITHFDLRFFVACIFRTVRPPLPNTNSRS